MYFANSQICQRVKPVSVKDLDNIKIAQSGCLLSNIMNVYSPSALPWNPNSVPSRGYYRINMTFEAPSLISSCDLWPSTDGSHSPTGIKFYDIPSGTLLASTPSLTSTLKKKFYNFSIPPTILSSVYVEIYKSTTWQIWINTLSCNTCYDPSPSLTSSQTETHSHLPLLSPSQTETHIPTSSISLSYSPTLSLSGSYTPVSTTSHSLTRTPSQSLSKSRTYTPSTSTEGSYSITPSESESQSITFTPTLNIIQQMATNSTLITLVDSLGSTSQSTILGSVGVGAGGIVLLFGLYKVIAAKFAPDGSGKRPSVSQVFWSTFGGTVKKVEAEVKKDVEELEAKVKKNLQGALKDPAGAFQAIKTDLSTSLNQVVVDVEKSTNIQIDPAHLADVKRMLTLMNLPHVVNTAPVPPLPNTPENETTNETSS
jgi:hypothetical protein